MILHSILSTRAVLHLSSTSTRTHGTNANTLTDYNFTTILFSNNPSARPGAAPSGGAVSSSSGGVYTLTVTDGSQKSNSEAADLVLGDQGLEEMEMGVLRQIENDEIEVGRRNGIEGEDIGAESETGAILEAPRYSFIHTSDARSSTFMGPRNEP